MKTSSQHDHIVLIIYVNLNLRRFARNQYDKPEVVHGHPHHYRSTQITPPCIIITIMTCDLSRHTASDSKSLV